MVDIDIHKQLLEYSDCGRFDDPYVAELCKRGADEIERLISLLYENRHPDFDYSLVDMLGFLETYEGYRR